MPRAGVLTQERGGGGEGGGGGGEKLAQLLYVGILLREGDLFVMMWVSTRDDMNLGHWVPKPFMPAMVHIEGSRPEWCISSMTYTLAIHHSGPKPHIEGSRPEWCISSMIYSRDTPFWP